MRARRRVIWGEIIHLVGSDEAYNQQLAKEVLTELDSIQSSLSLGITRVEAWATEAKRRRDQQTPASSGSEESPSILTIARQYQQRNAASSRMQSNRNCL